jgi:hypothetical protein
MAVNPDTSPSFEAQQARLNSISNDYTTRVLVWKRAIETSVEKAKTEARRAKEAVYDAGFPLSYDASNKDYTVDDHVHALMSDLRRKATSHNEQRMAEFGRISTAAESGLGSI